MLKIEENFSLKPLNTFGIDVKAKFFVEILYLEELKNVLRLEKFKAEKILFLGGGSNVLFLNDFDGLIVKIGIKGYEIIKEDDKDIIIKAGAGVLWHELVMYSVNKNWGGIENLSLIPGTVGAAPMQNIGAYGVEIKDTFVSLEALNLENHQIEIFDIDRCAFGYRDSIFKHTAKDKFVILNVSFKLSKFPEFKTNYGAVKETLEYDGIFNLTVKAVSDAVIKIRKSKLPDPAEIGNSGSFFKNPEIPKSLFEKIVLNYPLMPSYIINEDLIKIPAGWLIEQAGWKGKRIGNVGVHDKQALVLVNYGEGTGIEIKNLALKIQDSVKIKFGILISPEVNFIE
jgi:UDP-N-acetylmuramate dehydrogenase